MRNISDITKTVNLNGRTITVRSIHKGDLCKTSINRIKQAKLCNVNKMNVHAEKHYHKW